MVSFIELKTTPIKEIIFSISFSEDINSGDIDKFIANQDELIKKYSVKNKISAEIAGGHTEKITKKIFDHFVLQCHAEKKIIQIRKGSFSFHKLQEYEHFEKLITEFEKLWNGFINCVGRATVINISVRYLNFIFQSENETIKDLINIVISHPFGNQMKNQFSRLQFNYENNPKISVNLVTTNAKDENQKNGVILDIILNRKLENLQEYNKVFESFNEMRAVKNDLFFKSITEQTIKKYNND